MANRPPETVRKLACLTRSYVKATMHTPVEPPLCFALLPTTITQYTTHNTPTVPDTTLTVTRGVPYATLTTTTPTASPPSATSGQPPGVSSTAPSPPPPHPGPDTLRHQRPGTAPSPSTPPAATARHVTSSTLAITNLATTLTISITDTTRGANTTSDSASDNSDRLTHQPHHQLT